MATPVVEYIEKVTHREDGSVVLLCESGNPLLGIIVTPATDGRLIVCLPGADEPSSPFDMVNVLLGPDQVKALAALAFMAMLQGGGEDDGC